jgi:predicted nucleotidyltransferase
MLTDRHVQDIVHRIAAVARQPVKVIVFGSYGRGDATEDSDLDLLVVERDVPDHTEEYLRLRGAVGPVNVGVDLLLLLPQAEFNRRRDWASSPVYWATREGRVLYDGERTA